MKELTKKELSDIYKLAHKYNFDDFCQFMNLPLPSDDKQEKGNGKNESNFESILKDYIQSEFKDGKIDFHLRTYDGISCYIHPDGKDGNTLDFSFSKEVKTNTDLFKIRVDNKIYEVQQYITGGQIKALSGCFNQYYSIYPMYIPKDWPTRIAEEGLLDDEIIDLANPTYGTLFFETQFKRNKR